MLRWQTGAVIPGHLRPNLSSAERSYFSKYDRLLSQYMSRAQLDLTSDLTPPKSMLVEVVVLKSVGEVMTESGSIRLRQGERHLLKRSDAEQMIRQGVLEHVWEGGQQDVS